MRMRDVSKLNPRDFTPYRTKLANTFRQGLVAGKCNLCGKLFWDRLKCQCRCVRLAILLVRALPGRVE